MPLIDSDDVLEPLGDGGGATVVVGMSGGVDSSVAALLLKRAGYRVVGLFMKNWEDDDQGEYCSSRQDLVDAASAADVIGIDLEVVNFSAEYKERVFAGFLREYEAGRTPNPDVLCNSEIKFRAFLDHAVGLGAQRIATGHYAQVREFLGRFQLLKAEDGGKDQSYFLYRLNQGQLSRTLFPIGHLLKRQVRAIAREAGLANHGKRDSTGICFIGERPFREFLARYLPRRPGEIRTLDGDRVVGRHEGLMYYTLGQREGLGIGGVRGAAEEPWYVAGKDMARDVLLVVQGRDHPALMRERLVAGDLSWVAGGVPADRPHVHWVYAAKTRYRQPDAACEIERIDGESCEVAFAEPQWAVTPGQSVVLYESRVCLGGGIIS
ncbi:MAG: tRNA 2-thiouridine(34) synthase MnmA [Rhodocyclaceae bacterium]|nr:tRNA 2-thiouridine(34) synthase MnmA [Rhodocyclaceae bacterium]